MRGRIKDNKHGFFDSPNTICTNMAVGVDGKYVKSNRSYPSIIKPEEVPPWYEPRELRAFVSFLNSKGELIVIKKEVDPKCGVGGFLQKYEEQGKAVMFQKVKGANIPAEEPFHCYPSGP